MTQGLSSRFSSGAVQRNFLWAILDVTILEACQGNMA
jgi:hypothetical protein